MTKQEKQIFIEALDYNKEIRDFYINEAKHESDQNKRSLIQNDINLFSSRVHMLEELKNHLGI